MRNTNLFFKAGLMLLAALQLTPAFAGENYSPFGLSCTRSGVPGEEVKKVGASLDQRFSAIWGKDWAYRTLPAKRIEQKAMDDIAAIAGCAAMLDRSACSNFFDPEFGGNLSVFTSLGTKAPIRKQFDEAIAALPSAEARTAAQYCVKLVGKK
ncbi:hypothetical protein ABT364_01075 [Massilia sp. SR12]